MIPNLLEWQDSLIVLDIKQECFNLTSKYRQNIIQQDVFCLTLSALQRTRLIHFITSIWIRLKAALT